MWDGGMAFKNKDVRIDSFVPENRPAAGKNLIDESVLRLARLIGRQIAREDFERQRAEATAPFRRKCEAAT